MQRRHLLAVTGAALVLVVVTVLALFPGPLPVVLRNLLLTVVPGLPERFSKLLLVVALAGAGLVSLRQGRHAADGPGALLSGEQPLERPRNAPRVAGAEFDEAVADAIREIRLTGIEFEETEPREQLRETAERIVQISRGTTAEEPARVVADGDWTDDPVARAFLGDGLEYPVRFHLCRWAAPEQAYETAVERTCTALDRATREELSSVQLATDGSEADRRDTDRNRLGRAAEPEAE
jgi:hypothetical protein